MLYFLDISDGTLMIEDSEGSFVADPATLPALAAASVRDLLKQFPEFFLRNWSQWKLSVRDMDGAVVLVVPFRDVVTSGSEGSSPGGAPPAAPE